MEVYRICHVSTAKIKPGKGREAVTWWKHRGKHMYESLPGVESVKAYGAQFGLGGEGAYGLEIWLEMKNYAACDRIDEDLEANPQNYFALREAQDLFEWDPFPVRLMRDWPECHWSLPVM